MKTALIICLALCAPLALSQETAPTSNGPSDVSQPTPPTLLPTPDPAPGWYVTATLTPPSTPGGQAILDASTNSTGLVDGAAPVGALDASFLLLDFDPTTLDLGNNPIQALNDAIIAHGDALGYFKVHFKDAGESIELGIPSIVIDQHGNQRTITALAQVGLTGSTVGIIKTDGQAHTWRPDAYSDGTGTWDSGSDSVPVETAAPDQTAPAPAPAQQTVN